MNSISKKLKGVMSVFSRWKNDNESTKDGYLKYEEGQIIPVKSDKNYPPFLHDDAEDSVVKYKDVISGSSRKQQSKKENADITEKEGGEVKRFMNKKEDNNEGNKETDKKKQDPMQWIMRAVWLFIIGGLIYYSIPILQHFTSSTPDLSPAKSVVEDVADKTTEATVEVVGKIEETSETVTKTIDKVAEGSGIVEKVENNLSIAPTVEETDKALLSISSEEWLNVLSSTHNAKQEKLMQINNYTISLANGDIKHNRYKMLIKGVSKDINRHYRNFQDYLVGKDITQVDDVVTVVLGELNDLQDFAIALSSLSESNAIPRFNEGAEIQNEFNERYKYSFVTLLEELGVSYKLENGKIIF